MFHIYRKNAISEEGLKSLLPHFTLTDAQEEAEGILVRSADMHEERLSPATLAVARAGAGVNNIPLERLADAGVVVFNTPGANANSVKELVICELLLAARNVLPAVEWLWERKSEANIAKLAEQGKKQFVGSEIRGKKLGVIGLGAIGAEVANAAVALGMEVYGYDPYLSVNGAWRITKEARHATSLEELCRQCDYITLHVPLTDKNPGMIGEKEMAVMKEGVVFLNFSRDKLVDEQAMGRALESGKVRLYVTDFANPLSMTFAHAIVTPHLGASTEEAEDHCAVMAVKELMDYLDNGNIRNSVNYPDCDMGVPASVQRIALLHKNVPNMIGQISGVLAKRNINIDNMTNKSRGTYAYTLLDLETCLTAEDQASLEAIPGVIRFRAVTGG